MVIALDAGHGYNTSGKRCLKSLDPNQTREWYLNDRIMDIVESELKKYYECTPLRVDDTTGEKDISLSARVKAANQAKAKVYVSVHHDAGINGRLIGAKGKKAGGTTVYYYSSNLNRAAQAVRLYNKIISRTGLSGDRAEPVQKHGYYVLKNTTMPAFLIENGFMDSPTDVPIITSLDHAERTAKGIVNFLAVEYSLQPKNVVNEAPAQSQTYPAYTGEKTTLYNALAALGIDNTYSFRKKIAAANGITGYCGTATQNTRMYNLLVAGLLKKA